MRRPLLVLFLGVAGPLLLAQAPSLLDAHRITSGEFSVERFGPARWIDGAHYATLEPRRQRAPPAQRAVVRRAGQARHAVRVPRLPEPHALDRRARRHAQTPVWLVVRLPEPPRATGTEVEPVQEAP